MKRAENLRRFVVVEDESAKVSKPNGGAAFVMSEGLATLKEAQRFLRVSQSTIYVLMQSGELASTKIGRSRRIPWSALRELVARSLVGGPP